MQIDHIFIFSNSSGSEADELVNFGLTEGSSRVHPGQGTTNRKFYFENFFLEILWVHRPPEIQNNRTKPTKLWERSNFEHNEYSPFGLCLVNDAHSEQIFTNPSTYQPEYFPEAKQLTLSHSRNYLGFSDYHSRGRRKQLMNLWITPEN